MGYPIMLYIVSGILCFLMAFRLSRGVASAVTPQGGGTWEVLTATASLGLFVMISTFNLRFLNGYALIAIAVVCFLFGAFAAVASIDRARGRSQ